MVANTRKRGSSLRSRIVLSFVVITALSVVWLALYVLAGKQHRAEADFLSTISALHTRHLNDELRVKEFLITGFEATSFHTDGREPNTVNQAVLRLFFKTRNVECDFANNGAEAVEKFMQNSYDLILMDIQMSVTDGWEARPLPPVRNTRHFRSPSWPLPPMCSTPTARKQKRWGCRAS